MKMAIIGHGFVGKAVDYGFSNPLVEKTIIDPKYGSQRKDVRALTTRGVDLVFVCVPTPMGDDGNIDTSALDQVMNDLKYFRKTIAVKSTIIPSEISKYKMPNMVYNPEFLTEKSACAEFVDPPFHVFGGTDKACDQLKLLYSEYSLCNPCPTFYMSKKEASFVKYTINSFLATKITFFNQLYDTCKNHDVNYNKIIKAVGADKRVGSSHTKVPGFDGKQGYGGACFPKDTMAFWKFSEEHMSLLGTAIAINNMYRSQYERDDREKEQNIQFNHVLSS